MVLSMIEASSETANAPMPRGFLGSRTLPLIYVNMPKSACTTIKNIMVRFDTGRFLDDPLTVHRRSKELFVHWRDAPGEIERRLASDVVFTLVRHPLRRSYSCFTEKVHFTSPYSFGWVRRHVTGAYGADFEAAPTLERHRANFKAFLRFVDANARGTDREVRRDPHWLPQFGVLRNAERVRRIDVVGRVETFDQHFGAVLAMVGASRDFDVPRMNEGPKPPFRYEDVVDDEIRELGSAIFADDFQRFGYAL
ncbi:MAG: sulfotransferase family 2 domain-containing protein [Pseudomonadota bacterium]